MRLIRECHFEWLHTDSQHEESMEIVLKSLLQSTNIRHAHLRPSKWPYTFPISSIITSLDLDTRLLPSQPGKTVPSWQDVYTLFILPRLEHLTLRGFSYWIAHGLPRDINHTSKITSLYIEDDDGGCVLETDLVHILTWSQRLRKYRHRLGHTSALPEVILGALLPQQDHLQALEILGNENPAVVAFQHSLDMRNYHNLQRLTLPIEYVVPLNIDPSSPDYDVIILPRAIQVIHVEVRSGQTDIVILVTLIVRSI